MDNEIHGSAEDERNRDKFSDSSANGVILVNIPNSALKNHENEEIDQLVDDPEEVTYKVRDSIKKSEKTPSDSSEDVFDK